MHEKQTKYVKTGNAAQYFGVSHKTLERWRQNGKIDAINPTGGCWYYSIPSIECKTDKQNFLYARVSTRNQLKDLDHQCEYLRKIYPDDSYRLVRDIGGGLNFKRKGLETILEFADSKSIGTVVVAYKDRLSRFGFDLLDRIISKAGGKLVVLNNSKFSPEQEFTQDIISIITSFSARIHGFRKYKIQIQNDSSFSNGEPAIHSSTLDGNVSVDV
jgi:predicted site-specific integrase-resolvase